VSVYEGMTCELCDEVGMPYNSEEDYPFCPVHAMAMATDASIDNFTIDADHWQYAIEQEVRAGESVGADPLCMSCHEPGIDRHNWPTRWSRRSTVSMCTHHAVSRFISAALVRREPWVRELRGSMGVKG
jgi:hypothetical protein